MRIADFAHRGRDAHGSRRLRFGDFEFEPATRELSGPEGAVRLQPQPARLLGLLLENQGDVVSREQVRRRLWPDEVHVEFDQGMNTCIKRIRATLNDSAETPRYIETLPRLGYRFLAPVTEVETAAGLLGARGGRRRRRFRFALTALLAAAGLAAGAFALRELTAPPCADQEPAQVAGAGSATKRPDTPADPGRSPNP